MIVATICGGMPNRVTAVAFAEVEFRPRGAFQEPALIRFRSIVARVMVESEAFSVALERVARLSDRSAENEGEPDFDKAVIAPDVAAMPGADRRLSTLVGELPSYRKRAISVGRIAIKATSPATGALPGVIGRLALINLFNSRVLALASEDPDDAARLPGRCIASFRQYAPEDGDLTKDQVQARLAAAERLDPRRILDHEQGLADLTDDEVVAAAVMAMLPTADMYAPASPAVSDRFRSWRVPGLA